MEAEASRVVAAFDDLTEPVWEVCADSLRVRVANAAARAAGVALHDGPGALPMPQECRDDAETALREMLAHGSSGRDLYWTLSGERHAVELVRVSGDDGTVRGVL
ncbi:hypothetical protein, partial [Pseudonocardia sp. KRD291]|uniref:hypothetical protein n=1 Tax=Pseudonocardia sp. KRD291 TaxID=2792007 RepID=UPI001C49E8EF